MKTTSLRARAIACALLTGTAFGGLTAQPARAQAQGESKLINFPADKFIIAPGGVDMRTGRYAYSETDLSIGGGQSGALALTRTMPENVADHANPFGNFSHNWDIFLLETRVDINQARPVGNDYRMTAHIGGRSYTFEAYSASPDYAYKSDGPSAFLTVAGNKASASALYTLRAPDGAILVFRPIGGGDCADQMWNGAQRRCAFISEMTEPDGTHHSFHYVGTVGGAAGNLARLSRVTSSRGYALLLDGSAHRVTKACVLNLAQAGVPTNGLCPADALATASYAYEAAGRLESATGPGGGVARFTYSAAPNQGGAMGFVKAGQTAPWLTNHIGFVRDEEHALQEMIVAQNFADGQSYSYSYGGPPVTTHRPEPNIAGGSYTDAQGRTTVVRFDFPLLPGSGPTTICTDPPCNLDQPDDFLNYTYQQTTGPVEITDPLGRTTTMDYCDPSTLSAPPPYDGCSVSPLQWSIDPEGIKTVLEYDGIRNIRKATRHPRPGVLEPDGSTPAPIVVEAEYDVTNPKAQTRPLWTKDAKSHVTRYTYASQHGGVLTETGPAVDGVTAQKRYTYVQRQARLWNGDPAGPPVWLLDRMSFCKTGNPALSGTGCALGAGDEVITSYDYGPASGPNNLLPTATTVTADGASLRTCVSHDALGNTIGQTSARGVCP